MGLLLFMGRLMERMRSGNSDFSPPPSPWELFAKWYAEAEKAEINDPNAMILSTVGSGGFPSARAVLMKGYDEDGFVFYTNRQSRKGRELAANPVAGLVFHWKSLQRQVRIEGYVAAIGEAESDEYFSSRPRGSQIGAWASSQSRPLADRAELEAKVKEVGLRYLGKTIPRPPHWGGYRVVPQMIEFWQGRQFRLHDRIVYSRPVPQSPWTWERLYP